MKIIVKFFKWVLFSFILIIILLISLYFVYPKPFYHFEVITGNLFKWYGLEECGDYFISKGLSSVEGENKLKYGELYREASIQNLKNGNYQEAYLYLKKASKIDPEIEGYFGWVLLYYFKDYEKAIAHLDKYRKYIKDDIAFVGDDHVSYAIGLCYKNLGNYELALINFDDAISDLSSNYSEEWITHQMYFQKARVLHMLKRYALADYFYEKSLLVWPESAEVYYYKALLYSEINNCDEMCKALDLSYSNIINGNKSMDSYISLFDEVYEIQIKDAIDENCNNEY